MTKHIIGNGIIPISKNKLLQENSRNATTGSFRKMYSPSGPGATDYAEMAGYAPSEIGYAKVIVKDCNVVGVSKIVV